MKSSTFAKRTRSKSHRAATGVPQGFVAELNALSDEAAPNVQDVSDGGESILSTPRGTAVFRLEAPDATTVKLVAGFTGWEKRSLDLCKNEEGVWEITVALSPGRYPYRFLVDGEWHDDPQCPQCEANPYGTTNAVIEVV
jgi:hypothetical protein